MLGDSIWAGERRQFAAAYREHAAAVFSVAAGMGGTAGASDVTQAVFARFWDQRNRFDPETGSLRALLVTNARNVTIESIRPVSARREPDDLVAPVLRALAQLTVENREAVVMAFYGGLPCRDVAAALRVSEGTVKARIRSGLLELRSRLRECQDAPAPRAGTRATRVDLTDPLPVGASSDRAEQSPSGEPPDSEPRSRPRLRTGSS